jgi:phage anti-repressor protein
MSKHITERILKKDLIKLFTSVPHDFIEDFFDIISASSNGEVFSIDIEKAAKWLAANKRVLTRTLQRSYTINTDYIVVKTERKAHERTRGGHNKNNYFLTIDCFKRLCMRSNTDKAESVRTYFIEVDDFVSRYSDTIVKALVTNLNKPSKAHDGPGWIYVFRVIEDLLKVGQTTNLLKRLSTYNTGRASDVEMLATFKSQNRMKAEECVKSFSQAKRYKSRRELYKVDEQVVKRIMKVCAEVGDQKVYHNEKWNMKETGNYLVLFTSKQIPGTP